MKQVKTHKGWKIYKQVEDGTDTYYCFLPEESPGAGFSPEWESGSIQEMIDFIDSY